MRRSIRLCCLVAGLCLALLPTPADADMFYSFDYVADVLVTLDTDDATISVVGPPVLPSDGRARIALHDGVLYFYRPTPGCLNTWLATLTVDGLTANFWTAVQLGGVALTDGVGGGMDGNGSQLFAAFRTTCSAKPDQLAELSTSGVLSNVVDYSSFGVGFDYIAFAPGGDLYALDRGNGATADLYLVSDTPNVTLIGSHAKSASDNGNGVYTGMAFAPDGRLWLVENTLVGGIGTNKLRELDPSNGQILTDLTLSYAEDPGHLLTGLAHAPDATPVDATSWGRLKSMYR